MVDQQVQRLARQRLMLRLDERLDDVRKSVAAIQGNLASRGLGRSGALTEALLERGGREFAQAADLAWRNLWDILTTLGVSSDAQDLKQEIRDGLANHFRAVAAVLRAPVTNSTGEQAANDAVQKLEAAGRRALESANVEIDIFIAARKRSDTTPAQAGATTVNIYSPVGALQIGANANASVIQNLGTEDRRALASALDAVHEALRALPDSAEIRQEELLEVTRSARAELDKGKPNGSLLSSLLIGIATGVQTIASLEPAYRALKGAAAAIGIALP